MKIVLHNATKNDRSDLNEFNKMYDWFSIEKFFLSFAVHFISVSLQFEWTTRKKNIQLCAIDNAPKFDYFQRKITKLSSEKDLILQCNEGASPVSVHFSLSKITEKRTVEEKIKVGKVISKEFIFKFYLRLRVATRKGTKKKKLFSIIIRVTKWMQNCNAI